MKFKRIFDIIFSLLLLIMLWPIFILISIAIKLDSKGPIIYKQKRIGKDKNEFIIYKFRTMIFTAPNDVPIHIFYDSKQFVTRIGSVLRHCNLDKLPQIFNVVKGDMTFIGPKPSLWNQYNLIYSSFSNPVCECPWIVIDKYLYCPNGKESGDFSKNSNCEVETKYLSGD